MSFVPPSGPPNARIAILGDYPITEDEVRGEPFSGSQGHLLNQMLANVGIDRAACYITNVVKSRPARGDFKTLYQDEKCFQPSQFLTDSIVSLHKELSNVHPNIIVPLGDEALRAITGKRGISKWRGSILHTQLGKVLPTFHPSHIFKQYSDRSIAELDLRRVLRESTSNAMPVLNPSFLINPTFDEVLAFLRRRPRRIAYDIETTGDLVRCLGLADSPTMAICIPFISHRPRGIQGRQTVFLDVDHVNEGNSHWTLEEEAVILKALESFFSDPSIQFIAQNAQFDNYVLAKDFGIVPHFLYLDTMIAQHTCYAEMPKGLDFLASIYTDIPYYSDYDPSVDQQTWIYNCWDCVTTFQVAERLEKELHELGLWEFYYNHINEAHPALALTQQWGVKIDTVLREKMKVEKCAERDVLQKRVEEIIGASINLGSPKQLQELLYQKMGLPVQLNHNTKRPSTDKFAMEHLMKRCPVHAELLETIRKHSELDTLISGFLNCELSYDSRIYTNYSISGTVTGRLSSSKPLFTPGTNLQNIPIRTKSGKLLRRVFVADEGYSLIKADLSQAEFRIIVWLAKILRIVQKYQENPDFDIHYWVASIIYRIPEDQITKDQRGIAKNGVYGGNYKMYYTTAARVYGLPLSIAKFVLDEYRAAIPEIPIWWGEVDHEISRSSTIVSPLGRKRVFFGRHDDELHRAAYSHSAQCIVADIINRALTLIVESFPPVDCRPVMQIHDELVLLCRTELVREYAAKLRRIMEYPIIFPGVDVPLVIPADISSGPNWLDQEKVK